MPIWVGAMVGVGVMLGVRVMVGVSVIVGVGVSVGVSVGGGVKNGSGVAVIWAMRIGVGVLGAASGMAFGSKASAKHAKNKAARDFIVCYINLCLV